MSLPTYNISCTSCGFKQTYNPYKAKYIFLDCTASNQPEIGHCWCSSCQKFNRVLRGYTEQDAYEELSIIDSVLKEFTTGLFSKISLGISNTKRNRLIELEKEKSQILERISFFKKNLFLSRCITCNSENIRIFDLPNNLYKTEKKLSLKHSCGEYLTVQEGARYHVSSLPTEEIYANSNPSDESNTAIPQEYFLDDWVSRGTEKDYLTLYNALSSIKPTPESQEIRIFTCFLPSFAMYLSKIDEKLIDRYLNQVAQVLNQYGINEEFTNNRFEMYYECLMDDSDLEYSFEKITELALNNIFQRNVSIPSPEHLILFNFVTSLTVQIDFLKSLKIAP